MESPSNHPPSNFPPEEYTGQEKDLLILFRAKCTEDLLLEGFPMTPEQLTDAHLIRWLRARSLDVDKAYHMLRLSLQWRRDLQVDTILERESLPKDVQLCLPFANLGICPKTGYPVQLFPTGRHDSRSLLEKYGVDQCLNFQIYSCEMLMNILRKVSEDQKRPVTKFIQIIDFEGFSLRQITSKLTRDFIFKSQSILNENYPEMLHYACVLNAPRIFNLVFNLVKPLIPKETLDKVEIFGGLGVSKALGEKVPLELVPPHWGGSRPGEDEYCSKEDIWMYGPVDISFFNGGGGGLPNSTSLSAELLDGSDETGSPLTKVTIKARDTLKINLTVLKHDSLISWKFRTDSYDIGFQIVFEADGQVVLPFSRVPGSHQDKGESSSSSSSSLGGSFKKKGKDNYLERKFEQGTLACSRLLGIYQVVFDNSYSWTRAKTVYYSLTVIEP